MNALNIEIFSDLICPWCYIGRRRLEAGLKILGANELPNIIWRPFELNPDMPKAGLDRKAYRSAKFGSWERSQAMDREVAEIGRTLGLEFNYDRVLITPNTRAGHRLLWWARDKGLQDALADALFRDTTALTRIDPHLLRKTEPVCSGVGRRFFLGGVLASHRNSWRRVHSGGAIGSLRVEDRKFVELVIEAIFRGTSDVLDP